MSKRGVGGYELTTEAQHDLEMIVAYIPEEASVQRAIKVLEQLQGAMRKLAGIARDGAFPVGSARQAVQVLVGVLVSDRI
jgi:plasmid stabilization system protein ParE